MLATALRVVREGELTEPERLGPIYTLPIGRPVLTFAIKNARGHLRPDA